MQCTLPAAEGSGVGEQKQSVVEEALHHGRLHAGLRQVLASYGRPTDEQRQRLAHGDGLQQAPEEAGEQAVNYKEHPLSRGFCSQ